MRVFVLGGTGTIGRAVVAELGKRRYPVQALSRSREADQKLASAGAVPVRGDLSDPTQWADMAVACDAIVQVAATFDDDMGDVDAIAMRSLVHASACRAQQTRFIYTGGCWLYGDTGDEIATEGRQFDPSPSFSWMVSHAEMLLDAPNLLTAVIHPAMVYDTEDGGVFNRFLSAAKAGRKMEIWGNASTRWPLIASTDLARAYCDLVERPDLIGHFNAVAEEGVAVGHIVSTIANEFGSPPEPIIRSVEDVVKEYGPWAKGPTLDQQMTSRKLKAATGWEPKITDFAQQIAPRNGSIGR